jgi:hypothetical protein
MISRTEINVLISRWERISAVLIAIHVRNDTPRNHTVAESVEFRYIGRWNYGHQDTWTYETLAVLGGLGFLKEAYTKLIHETYEYKNWKWMLKYLGCRIMKVRYVCFVNTDVLCSARCEIQFLICIWFEMEHSALHGSKKLCLRVYFIICSLCRRTFGERVEIFVRSELNFRSNLCTLSLLFTNY